MKKTVLVTLVCGLILSLFGCNEEKANALQVAAKQFNNEAQTAINLYESFSIKTVAMPQESQENKISYIMDQIKESKEPITAETLGNIMDSGFENAAALGILGKKFDELRLQYSKFYGMFNSLEKGSYFASDQVKRGAQFAATLTIQLITFAEDLSNTEGYMFSGERTLLIEEINAAKKNNNDTEIKYAVISLLDIQAQERTAKQAIITQLLKASEAGKVVTESIKRYDSLSANDILNSINTSLRLFDTYSKTNTKMKTFLEKYSDYANTVRNDPYWSAILDINFN